MKIKYHLIAHSIHQFIIMTALLFTYLGIPVFCLYYYNTNALLYYVLLLAFIHLIKMIVTYHVWVKYVTDKDPLWDCDAGVIKILRQKIPILNRAFYYSSTWYADRHSTMASEGVRGAYLRITLFVFVLIYTLIQTRGLTQNKHPTLLAATVVMTTYLYYTYYNYYKGPVKIPRFFDTNKYCGSIPLSIATCVCLSLHVIGRCKGLSW